MLKNKLLWIPMGLVAVLAVVVFVASQKEPATRTSYDWQPTDNIPQIVKGVDLDKTFTFCGEELPTENFDVRERLDRELTVNTYWHSSTILSIKSTMRYFPIMDRILEEEGVPADLKYIAVAESALRNAVSPVGAKGIWQFMKGTGQEYGLEINDEVDERYHLEKSTRAAARYLRSLRNRYGDWYLAAAAYNMGGGNLNRNMRNQRAETYFELNLNQETSRYVFRLVAIKEILENPRAFGFYLEREDYYPVLDDYRVVEVDGSVDNWGDFAAEHGTTYRLLKVYNPWLIDHELTNRSGKVYEVRVP